MRPVKCNSTCTHSGYVRVMSLCAWACAIGAVVLLFMGNLWGAYSLAMYVILIAYGGINWIYTDHLQRRK